MPQEQSLYILRYPLVPEEPKQKRLDQLLSFCRDGKIDEVMFFLLPEEYNRGQWRESDYRPWLDFAAQAKIVVEKEGLATSLNPWHTLLHCDRGRQSSDVDFRRMVLENGISCSSVACPLCEKWLALFLKAFKDFALAGFKKIWVEDDFRFHNHNYSKGWGGCFCEHHMGVLKHRGMKANTRQELIANLNAKDIVHPDRMVWMDLNSETYLNMAKKIRATMDEVDPAIELGQMCSYIPTHSVEGRDWHKLIDAYGGPKRTSIRPHAAGYGESAAGGGLWSMPNLAATHDVVPKGTRSFMEIENFPMSAFSKSNHQTEMQMAFAIDGGCDGLTLDILDFLGNGPSSEPGMAPMLAQAKAKLHAVRHLTSGTEQIGIRTFAPINTPRLAPGTGVADLHQLPSFVYGWYGYLASFGYSVIPQTSVTPTDPRNIYTLEGNTVWAFSDAQLTDLLTRCKVLIDAAAARIIAKRGFAQLIGLKDSRVIERDAGEYSWEESVEVPATEVAQRAGVNCSETGKITVFETLPQAEVRTMIMDCFGKPVGVGSYTHANSAGGRTLVLPLTLPESYLVQNWIRKRWMDLWINELNGGIVPVPVLLDGAYVFVSSRIGKHEKTIFLSNLALEFYHKLSMRLPKEFASMTWDGFTHSRDAAVTVKVVGDIMTIETELAGNDWLHLCGH